MIKAQKLSYGYPDKELYDSVDFHLEEGSHGALIGLSGSGKSSLINIIRNPDDYMYTGKLEIKDNPRIAYVSQFPEYTDGNITVFDYIAHEFKSMQTNLDLLCDKMANGEDLDSVFEAYQVALDTFETLGGNEYESTIQKQLQLADLMKYAHLSISNLSGGEFKLVEVIRQMLIKPDLLIMDEPDVFLDFENQNALRHLINHHKGTLLVITHSRFLLNHCFNTILHLEECNINQFHGSYMDYNFKLLLEKIDLQEQAVSDTEEIKRNDIIIDNLRKRASYDADAARGRALGARVKIQERLMARRTQHPFLYDKTIDLKLNSTLPLIEEFAIEIKDLSIEYDEAILNHINLEVNGCEKIALIGANGTGKSSLLRSIKNASHLDNKNPNIQLNQEIILGYLSQNQGEVLKEDHSIFDEFFELGFQSYDEIASYMETFAFPVDVLDKPISNFSGGEKNILQLAKISVMNANFLLLDEPTSHLDIYSQLNLEDSLLNYNGGFLMITHDFYSIINCVDTVYIIRDKEIHPMKMKRFKQMIYAKYFNKNYLELEDEKKALELEIEHKLKEHLFEEARQVASKLEEIITKMT